VNETISTVQDRPPNFRNSSGKLYLVRCYACSPTGRENYAPAAATGTCNWCGYVDTEFLKKELTSLKEENTMLKVQNEALLAQNREIRGLCVRHESEIDPLLELRKENAALRFYLDCLHKTASIRPVQECKCGGGIFSRLLG
jgi:hypothetical protein